MAQLQPGDLFARRLRVVRQLGEGGMADVYLVEHVSLGRQYALKILKWNMNHRGLQERLRVEAIAMGRAQHRNIVAVHDLDEENGQLYITMDYVSGGSLRDRQRREGMIPSREAARIVIEILGGLQCAHDKGIVHRDVKPDNVLLDAEGIPKICDFGIARASGENRGFTQTGVILGTFWFMAPEQHKVTVRPDLRADLYATGVVLHALIAGIIDPSAPFFYETLGEDPEIMDPIPEALRPVIRRATARQTHKRYDSAAEMAAAIETVWSSLPTVSVERAARRIPSNTIIPEPAGMPVGTRFDLSSAAAHPDGSVSHEPATPRPVVAPAPSSQTYQADEPLPSGTMAGVPDHDEALTDPAHRTPRSMRRPLVLGGLAAILLLLFVYGFWVRAPESSVQAIRQTHSEAVTSPKESEPVEGSSAPSVVESAPAVVPVVATPLQTTPAKAGKGGKEAKASQVPPRVETVAAPPMPVEVSKTRVTLTGDATLVRLIGDAGSFTLPTSVPHGSYRVIATFEGEAEPVTAIKRLEVDDKPVAISCDSAFVRCNRQ